MPRLANLGHGSRICRDRCWTNMDLSSLNDQVISHNLLQGIPFPDDTFDGVYHSDLLEHFSRGDGERLMRECFPVLRPGGIVRVVVPDLEQICRAYLDPLEKVESGNARWRARYDWIVLEMQDQATRTAPGGEMTRCLRQPNVLDPKFVIARTGTVGRDFLRGTGAHQSIDKNESVASNVYLQRLAGKIRLVPRIARKLMRSIVLNQHERKALRLGLFRLSGEVHEWMYDRYSLRVLLHDIGFAEIRQCSGAESSIPRWNVYFLDIDPDGFEHAPSSLYMEGFKPK